MIYSIGNVVGWPKSHLYRLEWIVAKVEDETINFPFLHLVSLSLADRYIIVPDIEVEFLASCVTDHILQSAGIDGEL